MFSSASPRGTLKLLRKQNLLFSFGLIVKCSLNTARKYIDIYSQCQQGKTAKITSCIDRHVLVISFPFASETAKDSSSKRREQRSNDQDEESTSKPTLESFSNTNTTDNEIVDGDDDSFSWDDDEEEEFEDPSRKEPSFLKREQMAVIMARENFKVLKLVGHRFEDMELSCMFRGVSCG